MTDRPALSRAEAAEIAQALLHYSCSAKTGGHYYSFGACEIRHLLDAIYGGEPDGDAERVHSVKGDDVEEQALTPTPRAVEKLISMGVSFKD